MKFFIREVEKEFISWNVSVSFVAKSNSSYHSFLLFFVSLFSSSLWRILSRSWSNETPGKKISIEIFGWNVLMLRFFCNKFSETCTEYFEFYLESFSKAHSYECKEWSFCQRFKKFNLINWFKNSCYRISTSIREWSG